MKYLSIKNSKMKRVHSKMSGKRYNFALQTDNNKYMLTKEQFIETPMTKKVDTQGDDYTLRTVWFRSI
jgi:hypothetical protein